MTILSISKRGTLKLPREVVQHLLGAKHLQVRLGVSGVTLTPVEIKPAIDIKGIPESKSTSTK